MMMMMMGCGWDQDEIKTEPYSDWEIIAKHSLNSAFVYMFAELGKNNPFR